MQSKAKKFFTTSATALMITGASVGVAMGEAKDGGQWHHGNSGGRVWSNYWHPKVKHGSSVQGRTYVDSGCVSPNIWSRAQTKSKITPWGVDGSYYRFC